MSYTKNEGRSFILSDLIDGFAEMIGWFDAGPFKRLDENANYVEWVNGPVEITKFTTVIYFPGCFAHFHQGHLQAVKEAVLEMESRPSIPEMNYVVVIAPANSDYTAEKYGENSLYATNKYRYEHIMEMLEGVEGNIAIDLNPMLNFDRDYNFTDLVYDFVQRQGINYEDLALAPYILCGKDRAYFENLNKYTNQIRVMYVRDTTGSSSSGIIEQNPQVVPKKDLILRCHNRYQFELFRKHFGKYYNRITMLSIEEEREWVKKHIDSFDVTICKDYKDLLPYVEIHRNYVHPLHCEGHVGEVDYDFAGKRVVDSDIFSGGTAKFITSKGGTLVAHADLLGQHNTELLDFDDFKNVEYCYPSVDMSSRCSLPAFTKAMHKELENFWSEVYRLEQLEKKDD